MLGLTALETQRLRGDLIEVFKIFKGLNDVKHINLFFALSNMELRGHGYKFQKQHVRLDVRKFLFAIRLEIVELLA